MSLYGALAEHNREGKRVAVFSGALADGVLELTTDFATIDAVSVAIEKETAPTTSVLTYGVDGNVVTVYGWKVTGAGDTTLIATTGTETLSVTVIGRLR